MPPKFLLPRSVLKPDLLFYLNKKKNRFLIVRLIFQEYNARKQHRDLAAGLVLKVTSVTGSDASTSVRAEDYAEIDVVRL